MTELALVRSREATVETVGDSSLRFVAGRVASFVDGLAAVPHGFDPLYDPGDTHWTARGAWTGCNALLSALDVGVHLRERVHREHALVLVGIAGEQRQEIGHVSRTAGRHAASQTSRSYIRRP